MLVLFVVGQAQGGPADAERQPARCHPRPIPSAVSVCETYRYSVARLTPRYLAIALPVWPALAKQVSFLNIRDPHEPVHSARNSPGRRVRYPSVTGESEFP
jgi:hypothetical protein